MQLYVVGWKGPSSAAGRLGVLQFSRAEADVSRLREGAAERGPDYMAQVKGKYVADL